MLKIVLIRQRPAIGDMLLLAPLVRAIKHKHPKSTLTVVTDSYYLGGALTTIAQGVPGVDSVISVDPHTWTTPGNLHINPHLHILEDTPLTIKNADLVYDCNSAFIEFERECSGKPPYGIAEFWLRHFKLYKSGDSLLPKYSIPADSMHRVDAWVEKYNPHHKSIVGVVLRAGDPVRDWDYNNLCNRVVTWLHTRGFLPVGIDPIKKLPCPYGVSCVGQQLDFIAGLISTCALVLTPDTGLLHLAEAVGTPTVALWGIMPPDLRVKGYNTVVVPKESLGHCDGDTANCKCTWKFQKWSCLRRLTLPLVTAGIRELLP